MLLHERARQLRDGGYTTADHKQIRALCSTLLRGYSESSGKYLGCPHWSPNAVASFRRHGKVVTSVPAYGPGDALRHEHVFPRRQLVSKLFELTHPNQATVTEILSKFCVAAVVTEKEHQGLSTRGTEPDPWFCYREAGLDPSTFSCPLSDIEKLHAS